MSEVVQGIYQQPGQPDQYVPLKVDAEGNLSVTLDGVGGGSGVDRELVVTTYRVKTAFTGASIGDTITATQIIDVTSTPTTISTIWRNQTTAADLAGAPSAANLEIVGSQALTDAQLRASAVTVTGTVTANTGLTQPLTDAQLRATSVAVAPNITRGDGAVDANTQRVTIATASATPGLVTITAAGTTNIGTGSRSFTVTNLSPGNVTFAGGTIPPGVALTWIAPLNSTFGSLSFVVASASATSPVLITAVS